MAPCRLPDRVPPTASSAAAFAGTVSRVRAELTPAQTDRLERIARAWQVLGGDELGLPETDETLDALEASLGRRLPPEVRAVYRTIGHPEIDTMSSNLFLAPLLHGDDAVATCADQLRGWDWEIPEEVVVIGGDGGGRVYGLWLPPESSKRHPVLLLDTGDDDGPDMGSSRRTCPHWWPPGWR